MNSKRLHALVNSRDTSGQILPTPTRNHEARSFNHTPKFLLARKPLDTLHQILIARTIRRDELADDGNRTEAPPLVDSIEQAVVHLAELQARKNATRFQHSESFLEGSLLVGKIPDTKGDGVESDGVALDHAELLRVGF